MPIGNFIMFKGIRINQGAKGTMKHNSPFGNGGNHVNVEIVCLKNSGDGRYNIGIASNIPIEGWHDLDGMVPQGQGYWVTGNELFRYFSFQKIAHPLIGKKIEVKDFKFRKKDLTGMKCKVLAPLPDGKSSFVEMSENVGGCGSDGLGKAGHCIVIPNKKLVESKPKKDKPNVKSKST